MSHGVSRGPFWPRAPECPKTVPTVSPGCQEGVRTLRGHSRDTFWTLRSPGQEGPLTHAVGHSVGYPPFSGTPCRGHFGPKGPERLLYLVGEFPTVNVAHPVIIFVVRISLPFFGAFFREFWGLCTERNLCFSAERFLTFFDPRKATTYFRAPFPTALKIT